MNFHRCLILSGSIILNLRLFIFVHLFAFLVVHGTSRKRHIVASLLTRFLFFWISISLLLIKSLLIFALGLLLALLIVDTFGETHAFKFLASLLALCISNISLFQSKSLACRLKDES